MMDHSRSSHGGRSQGNSARPSRRSSTGPQQEVLRETVSGVSQLSMTNGCSSPSRLSIASNPSDTQLADTFQAFSIEIAPDHPPTESV